MTDGTTPLDPTTRRAIEPHPDTATPVPDLDAAENAIRALTATDPDLVAPEELTGHIQRLQRLHNQVGTLKARWLASAETRALGGSRGTARWASQHLGVDPNTAARELDAGRATRDLPAVAQAATAGDISPDHARVIAKAVDKIEPERKQQAAETLVAVAKNNTPRETARQARLRKMKDSPDKGLSQAQDQLDKRYFRLHQRGDGMYEPIGRITPEVANKLLAGLEPLLHPDGEQTPPGDKRTYGQRMHDALRVLADTALASGELSQSRGLPTQAFVIIDMDWVLEREGATPAITFDGEPLSAETCARILCDADLTRVITEGRSELLDVGRTKKVWPAPMRKAIYARDRGRCRRCGAPAQTVHHIKHWKNGGETSVENGLSSCYVCHIAVHEGDETITVHDDGTTRFRGPRGQVLERPPP